jgi:hypothetical protein
MYNVVVVKRLEGACSPPAHSVLHQGGERQQRTAGRQGGREGPEDRRIGWVTASNTLLNSCLHLRHCVSTITIRCSGSPARTLGDGVQSCAEVAPAAKCPEGYDDLLALPIGVEAAPHAAGPAATPLSRAHAGTCTDRLRANQRLGSGSPSAPSLMSQDYFITGALCHCMHLNIWHTSPHRHGAAIEHDGRPSDIRRIIAGQEDCSFAHVR